AVPAPCTGARARIDEVWNDARRAELRRAFEATRVAWAADSLATTIATLDADADAWVAAHTEACRATAIEGVQSEHALDLRMSCLARHRDELDAVVGVLIDADAAVVREATSVAQGLAPIEECANVEVLAQRVPEPADLATRERIAVIARELSRAHALAAAGRPRAATEEIAALVPRARELAWPPLVAEALQHQGELASRRGDAAAEAILEESVWTAVRAGADATAARAAVELTHFVGYANARPHDALRWFELAHAFIDRAGGSPGLEVRLFVTRGAMTLEQGQLARAMADFEHAREVATRSLAPDDRLQGMATTAVANALFVSGKPDEALPLYEEALALFERTLGASHPAVGDLCTNIGNVHWAREHGDDARRWYERALTIAEQTHGAMHPDVAAVLVNLAATFDQQERYGEARPLLERALSIYEATLGPSHPDLVDPLHNLGIELEALGELDAAETMARRAVAIQDASFGPEHPDTISTLRSLASILDARGKQAERAELLERAHAISLKVSGADAEETRQLADRLADARAKTP
ncbi:MAG TPA: tetratricopeptide repeat protein, partial [Nannocystaceae bacterium]|nr:tetratricopeptide repeat protein [Nannocystaceae bacterium]